MGASFIHFIFGLAHYYGLLKMHSSNGNRSHGKCLNVTESEGIRPLKRRENAEMMSQHHWVFSSPRTSSTSYCSTYWNRAFVLDNQVCRQLRFCWELFSQSRFFCPAHNCEMKAITTEPRKTPCKPWKRDHGPFAMAVWWKKSITAILGDFLGTRKLPISSTHLFQGCPAC